VRIRTSQGEGFGTAPQLCGGGGTLLLDRHEAAVGGEVAPRRPAIPTGTCGIENAAPPGVARALGGAGETRQTTDASAPI
jgi:hypothetical protein